MKARSGSRRGPASAASGMAWRRALSRSPLSNISRILRMYAAWRRPTARDSREARAVRPVRRWSAVPKREPAEAPPRVRWGSGSAAGSGPAAGGGSSRARSPEGERVAAGSAGSAPRTPARNRRTQTASSGSSRRASPAPSARFRVTPTWRAPASSASQIWRCEARGKSGGEPSRGAPTTQTSSHSGRSSSRVRQAAISGPDASCGVRALRNWRSPSAPVPCDSTAPGCCRIPQAKRAPAASARRARARRTAICAIRGPPSWPGPASNTARHAAPAAAGTSGANSAENPSSSGTSAGAASGGSASRDDFQTDGEPADSMSLVVPPPLRTDGG